MSAAPDPDCLTCSGNGWAADRENPLDVRLVKCSCLARAQSSERLEALAGRYGPQTFATFDTSQPGVMDAYSTAMAYAAAPEGWLILTGPYGCGKTHLAQGIAAAAIERGMAATFTTVLDLLNGLKATFTHRREYDQNDGEYVVPPPPIYVQIARYRAVPLLVLDDLGAEKPGAWVSEVLFTLLNDRYQRSQPTVVTTNLDLDSDAALEHLGGRIVSRLSDAGLVERVALRAGDYRRVPTHQRKAGRHAA